MTKQHINSLKPNLIKKTAKIRTAALAATSLAKLTAKAPINDLQPDLKIEHLAVKALEPAKRRTRKATPGQRDAIIKSIQRFGFVGAILVKDGVVVDGHSRLDAMQALGEPTIPTIDVKHLSADECRLLSLSLNRIAETGEWDLEILREEMIELEALELDLSVTNFSPPELDIIKLNPDVEDDSYLDDSPGIQPGAAVSRLGDIWRMGPHRLLCGNSLEAASYETLMGDERMSCVFTDPPYNLVLKGNVTGLGKIKHDEFVMASGELSNQEFSSFLATFLMHSRAYCAEGAVVYACMDWRNYARLVDAAEAAGLKNINMAVWDKGSGGMGTLYRSAHELIGVFCNGKSPATNNVSLGKHGRDRINIWHYLGANKKGSSAAEMLADHPCPKPTRLVADALLDVTKMGDLVLDPFMGSGTTIIACAEVGRIARGIELDSKYVDVAVRRWNALAGQEATLGTTQETFSEVEARRAKEA